MAKTLRPYKIGAHIHAWCDTTIDAESLEDAARRAVNLTIEDFVTFTNKACIDCNHEIIQVYDAQAEL